MRIEAELAICNDITSFRRLAALIYVTPRAYRSDRFPFTRFSIVRAGFNDGSPVLSATLTGYAYETLANTPIAAGQTADDAAELESTPGSTARLQPASLGLLATGSLGFAVRGKE